MMNLIRIVSSRLPRPQQIVPVYAVIVLFLYGWSISRFLYEVPSWILFLRLDEIFYVFSYEVVINFLESLVVLGLPLGLSFLLPGKWFRDEFIVRGTVLAAMVLCGMMYFVTMIERVGLFEFPSLNLQWIAAAIFLTLFAVTFTPRSVLVKKIIEGIADRTIIFLYILLPISVIGFFIVIVNNLF